MPYDFIIFLIGLGVVIGIYFKNNPLNHTPKFIMQRFISWFPLGMSYAFLYMARYNLVVSKNALGTMMSKEDFGIIFAAGTTTYALSFFLNGPLVDHIGGKKGIIIATIGASLMNIFMGIATYLFLHNQISTKPVIIFSILYSLNMFFQSYGAVSIIKVKAYWFHVRERGIFGAIFGTLISFGAYFAFDWGRAIADASKLVMTSEPTFFQSIIRKLFVVDLGNTDAVWLVFFIPAILLIFWALMDIVFIKDSPAHAGFDEFDPHDAASDDDYEHAPTTLGLIKKILTHPVLIIVGFVEFTSGVLRNGVMQWYLIFAKDVPQAGAEVIVNNWGLGLALSGILGGFTAGIVSDKIFHSRRGPPAVAFNIIMAIASTIMALSLFSSPLIVGISALVMNFAVIGVHSIMSGTAAADFGGKKATATASGLVDACVYFGSGLQSISLGYLVSKNWQLWPMFLIPFALLGTFAALKIWSALPEATRRYLVSIEKVTILTPSGSVIQTERDTITITDK